MKTISLQIIGLFLMIPFSSYANGKLDITFSYERQEGPGSNQYAIWIEDANGNLVKTIYVTNFTAQGGYEKRPACVPKWTAKANPASLAESEIDSFSGATPQTGVQTYTWYGTDNNGRQVAVGKYTFTVEATLKGESWVIFKGDVEVGGAEAHITTTPEYIQVNENKDMIKEVKAHYQP